MSRLMSLSVPFVVAFSVASGSVVAYDVQPVDFKPKKARRAAFHSARNPARKIA